MTKSLFSAHYARLCTFLVQARIDAGLTQAQLARLVNKPQSFVSKYETRQRRLDMVEFIELARALKVGSTVLMASIMDGWATGEAKNGVANGSARDRDLPKLDGLTPDRVKLEVKRRRKVMSAGRPAKKVVSRKATGKNGRGK